MERKEPNSPDIAMRISEAIWKKFESHRDIVNRSPNYGRLIWRVKRKNGEIEVDLELKF